MAGLITQAHSAQQWPSVQVPLQTVKGQPAGQLFLGFQIFAPQAGLTCGNMWLVIGGSMVSELVSWFQFAIADMLCGSLWVFRCLGIGIHMFHPCDGCPHFVPNLSEMSGDGAKALFVY